MVAASLNSATSTSTTSANGNLCACPPAAAANSSTNAGDLNEAMKRCRQQCNCNGYGRVCPYSAYLAGETAMRAVTLLREDSGLFQTPATCDGLHQLRLDQIDIGDLLGEGGFCVVKACTIKGDPEAKSLAIKHLKRQVMVTRKQFLHGAADLAQEAYFLHALQHKHIIKLHGMAAGCIKDNIASGQECGFFITVDRLYDTLEQRLERWRLEEEEFRHHHGLFSAFLPSAETKEHKKELFQQKLQIAIDIASAIDYLHQNNIIFRDLKPDNIGFDKDGTLKLFDFGLAKELKKGAAHADGRYHLTGHTGSRRYMAPEVAKELPYNASVDVYSFGILLQEILSGEKPFCGYSAGKHMSLVVMGGERPRVDSHWPITLQHLVKRCWSPFPTARPDFPTIQQTLQEILDSCKNNHHPCPYDNHHHNTVDDNHTVDTNNCSGNDNNIAQLPPAPMSPKTKLEPPVGGFSSLLRPIRGKAKSHGTDNTNTTDPATDSPVQQHHHQHRGISLGFFSRK